VSIAGGGPAAGWYADPADASQERWWDGTQWSATTRPLVQTPPTPPPYAAPSFAPPAYEAPTYSAPTYTAPTYTAPTYTAPTYTAPTYSPTASQGQIGGGHVGGAQNYGSPSNAVEPYSPAGSYAAIGAYTPTGQTGSSAYGGQNQFGSVGSSLATQSSGDGWSYSGETYTGNTAWGQGSTQTPEPTGNGLAVTGFVLSLLGFGLISLIISILGLRKARGFAAAGMWPRGRGLAKWGIGLSIWTMLVGTAVLAFWLYLAANPQMLMNITESYLKDFQTTQTTPSGVTDGTGTTIDVNDGTGTPATDPTDVATIASHVSDQYTELNGVTPTSVQCTVQSLSGPNGPEYLCAIATPDGSVITMTYSEAVSATSP
jgi:hypothetical protein